MVETMEETAVERQELEAQVIEKLKQCYDPEIPVNIYEMGLVYKIDIRDDNAVLIDMTLTSPACPVAESLPLEVETAIKQIAGIKSVQVNIVWEPTWNPDMMSEAAKLDLGFF